MNTRKAIRHQYTHPALRLASNDSEFALTYRRFNALLRGSLDPGLPSAQRALIAREVLQDLSKLQLSERGKQEFLIEWLRDASTDLTDVYLLDVYARAELREHKIELAPIGWRSEMLIPEHLPHLTGKSVLGTEPMLPPVALTTWQEVIVLTRRAVAAGEVVAWDACACHAAIRALVICCVLGNPEPDLSDPRRTLRFFEGEGTSLWRALDERLTEVDSRLSDQIERRDLQQRLVLHLRGMADTQATSKRSEGVDGAKAVAACRTPVLGDRAPTIIVIRDPIPPANDRPDKDLIKQFEPLQLPLPVARMPRPEQIGRLLFTLRGEFPWAAEAIERLQEILLPPSRLGVQELVLRPVLVVGPPGSGKSRFCRRVADILGWPFLPIPCGGSSDMKQLSGTSRGWATGEPTPLLRAMLTHKTASVFVLLDEVDKAAATHSTSPPLMSVLLGLLEPETSARYRDVFLHVPCDLSRVAFWATANSLKRLPAALLSRFDIVYMPGPQREHMPELARSIVADLEREWRLPHGVLPRVPDSFWFDQPASARLAKRLVQKYVAEWSERELSRERLH